MFKLLLAEDLMHILAEKIFNKQESCQEENVHRL
ncbi:MAG: hypothetical protein H6Q21_1817 [Bacteroidetes bacterium]|jgi:hypothetical protein|nr:hypothetical protein [Bacteroidota bacterium]